MSIELDPVQQQAVALICQERFGIITGGPGTGKTTCLREAIAQLRGMNRSVMLLAPTGKAARRMSEATQQPASTVHRALYSLQEGDRLVADVVIVDEASMLDVHVSAWLLDSLDLRHTALFLVGDVNQLPSVGPGYILGDLIASGRVPVVELKTVHRSAQKSWIYRNAPRILAGDLDALELDPQHDFSFIRSSGKDTEAILRTIEREANLVGELIGQSVVDFREAMAHMQVLVPMRKSPIGVRAINEDVQRVTGYGGGQGWKLIDGTELRDGDKVMQTKNDYALDLMNGEQGFVQGTRGKDYLVCEFDDRDVHFSREASANLQLSYATTIHKSQGSEWPLVIVICHSAHRFMLTRQLVYTAVTRAKQRVVLVGDDEGLERALSTENVTARETGLCVQLERAR